MALVVALGLASCGGTSDPDAIRASVSDYLTALAKHEPAAACARVTPPYWSATAQELNGRLSALSASAPTLSTTSCQQGLTRLFSLSRARGGATPKFSLTNVTVQGKAARATLSTVAISSAGGPQNARFVKSSDGWRIDCCTGSQQQRLASVVYRVPSASMLPTLKVGQTVTSDNAALRTRAPALGEIVLLHPSIAATSLRCAARDQGASHRAPCGVATPPESSQTFIKRIVGLPGDRIAIVNGHVLRNGVREPDAYIEPCVGGSQAAGCNFPKPIVVPAGEYYVMGDNRGQSDDSRFWGPVKRAWLIGLVRSG